jgi:hypothetical protein
MAIDKQIDIHELALPSRKYMRRSRFALIGDLHNLASYNWTEICRAVDRYVLFRLAGPAAEWTRLEKHHDLSPGSDEQVRLRQRFCRERIFASHADFDVSYGLLTAWMFTENAAEADGLLIRYWQRACDGLGYGPMWHKVQQIALSLMDRGSLSREEVQAIYGEEIRR